MDVLGIVLQTPSALLSERRFVKGEGITRERPDRSVDLITTIVNVASTAAYYANVSGLCLKSLYAEDGVFMPPYSPSVVAEIVELASVGFCVDKSDNSGTRNGIQER
jgi:hypothetical protein